MICYFSDLLLYWSVTLLICYFTDLLLYWTVPLLIFYFTEFWAFLKVRNSEVSHPNFLWLYIAVSSCFIQLFLSSLHGTSELSHLGFSKDSSKPKHLGICCQSNSSICLPSLSYLLEPIYALCHVMSIFLWRLAGRASAELKHWYTAASNMICICDVKFFHALSTSR